MTIKKIVILPPLAFARFGSHPEPVASYTLEDPAPDEPLGHRKIKPEPTLIVSQTGDILREDPNPEIQFKEKGTKFTGRPSRRSSSSGANCMMGALSISPKRY